MIVPASGHTAVQDGSPSCQLGKILDLCLGGSAIQDHTDLGWFKVFLSPISSAISGDSNNIQ